jgi:hypothetical protein
MSLFVAFSPPFPVASHTLLQLPSALEILEHYVDTDFFPQYSDLVELCKIHHVLFFCSPPHMDTDLMEDAIDIVFTEEDEEFAGRLDLVDLLGALRNNKTTVAKNLMGKLSVVLCFSSTRWGDDVFFWLTT